MRAIAVWIAAVATCGLAHAAPTVQATLIVGNSTAGIATDPVLAKVFVTNQGSASVSVIDIDTLSVVATIPVTANPKRVIADAATHRVYVAHATAAATQGTVTVIDGQANSVLASIPVGNDPAGITADFFIGEVYVANNGSNTVSVIGTAGNAVVATIPVGGAPTSITSNDRLKKLYVTNAADNTVSSIDEATHVVVKTIAVGKGPITPTIDGQHGKVYVNNIADRTVSVIDSSTDIVVKTVPSGQGTSNGGVANFVTVNAVYERAYLPNGADGTLTIIDTDHDVVVGTVAVGAAPVEALVDANGGNVYVVNQGGNSVSILDAAAGAVIDTLAVGGAPWRLADALNRIFVLNTNGGAVDSVTIAAEENTLGDTAIATEFYEADFNHYFHTADELETRLLLDGIFADSWHRTFEFWRVWTTSGPGRVPVCRFFSAAFGALSSHFYTPYAAECTALRTDPALSAVWQLETTALYYLALTDANGNCPAGTVPLYRVYNNGMGGAPNHRYTGDRTVRDSMVAQGWLPEGGGPDLIFACTPPLVGG
jgi:YVTN family beta-propeller protein